MDLLKEEGIETDALRITSFPFSASILEFIDAHETVFVIEQNRDAQMKKILTQELEVHPKKLVSVLNYDGMPITANYIHKTIEEKLKATISKPQLV